MGEGFNSKKHPHLLKYFLPPPSPSPFLPSVVMLTEIIAYRALFPAIVFAFVVIFIFLYIPGLNTAINSSKIPVEYFFLPLAFGLWILFTDEVRKYYVRKYPKGFLAKLAW